MCVLDMELMSLGLMANFVTCSVIPLFQEELGLGDKSLFTHSKTKLFH